MRKKTQAFQKLLKVFFKITQGFEITQAHFDEKTQSTGGLCHVHPPKKCSKKTSGLIGLKWTIWAIQWNSLLGFPLLGYQQP